MSKESQEMKLDELEALKRRADIMGISYHPNIGLETLKRKIDHKLNSDKPDPEESEDSPVPTGQKIRPASKAEIANFQRKQAHRLVRVQLNNMNPNKKEWEGEIFTAGNSVIGSVRKYVPFNTPTHVPQILLNMIKERKCQIFYSVKDKFGNNIKKAKLIPEFGIQELPPLTREELKALAAAQLAVNGAVA